MQPIVFTPEMILNVIAVIASLLASYFPPLAVWYAGLKSEIKSVIMIGAMVVVTTAICLLVNFGLIPSESPISWLQAAYYLLQALIFNAGTYIVSPQTRQVKAAKEYRNSES